MKSDRQLRDEVEAELDWDPCVDSRDIGVAVREGIATLLGYVDTYPERWAAQQAVETIAGVKAVANDIEVNLAFDSKRSDTQIAADVLLALKSNISIPASDLRVIVREGWITLQGEVQLRYQKNAAETAVRSLRGVKGVSNMIMIKPTLAGASAAEIKVKIEAAF